MLYHLYLMYGLNNDAFASLVFENSTGYNTTYHICARWRIEINLTDNSRQY